MQEPAQSEDSTSPVRGMAIPCLMPKEDEEVWPANPWQAQADAHLQYLHRSSVLFQQQTLAPAPVCVPVPVTVQDAQGAGYPRVGRPVQSVASEGLLRRISELEGQVAALEETSLSQRSQLLEAESKLDVSPAQQRQQSRPPSRGSRSDGDEVEALQRKNDFLSVLISRFERKTMALEEELAALTVLGCGEPPATCSQGSQTEAKPAEELEGQLALLEESLASKDRRLFDLEERLREEQLLRRKTEAVVNGRTPQQLAAEVEALQSRAIFLGDLVARYEDKTISLERQLKTSGEARKADEEKLQGCLQRCKQQQQAEEQLREDAESATLALRDAKKEHNRKVQELLRQVQQLEAKGRRELEAKTKAREAAKEEESQELKEVKELNAQLVEKLCRERAEHADTRRNFDASSRECDTLSTRIGGLSSQLVDLAEQNELLEAEMQSRRH